MGGYEGPGKHSPYPNDTHIYDTKTGLWSRKEVGGGGRGRGRGRGGLGVGGVGG